MSHIMVDIETLDTVQSAVVLSIGAVVFDPETQELGEKFYVELTDDMRAQQALGRTISADTVKWWMQQAAEAKTVFADNPPPDAVYRLDTVTALQEFGHFIDRNGGNKVQLWGNGADFDNVIIGSLYESFGMQKPWSFGKNRCYRTIKQMFGTGVPLERIGAHHNGLDDAITQAVHLQRIFHARLSLDRVARPSSLG